MLFGKIKITNIYLASIRYYLCFKSFTCLTHLIITTILNGEYYYHPHFANGRTEKVM